ncbi:MAG: response regulator transcription factor [Bacteroidetes bacterium]|jgi:two-component system, OmpR family, response regulator|nr:response regulator transcription factor [Bacteroidota bacterium]MBT3748423.1 response regulator transcription factor [Bacteroidota bacterium]MBT4398744.1 response regulator transcription factor [Bacteroidota bacterium]MBT4411691.1 response regulator transcription factor [Bacteroidota bacterium]MBT5425144.1 response regulator transcription factor [Bacteroidota bacterium]
MEKTRVLLVEDDMNLGSLLKEYLMARGYDVDLQKNGAKGLNAFRREHFDICILDVMMPVKDGFTLAKDIRIMDNDVPIIFLTAKSMKTDILEGFNIGADDYITKPFSMEELLMRIEAIIRRTTKTSTQEVYILGNLTFDSNKQILSGKKTNTKLTTKESDLLKLLCQHSNQILERNYALKAIWKDDNYFNARSMDVYITKLRKHLQDVEDVQIINVHGKGYKLLKE